MKWLTKIRNKPVAVRRQILYVTTFVLIGVVILFWALTLPYRFRDVKQESLAKSLEPFRIIKDTAVDSWSQTKESVGNFNYEE